MIAVNKIIYMPGKTNQIKAYIYPDIYEKLIKSKNFEDHGLSYAVNAELANQLGLPAPETPVARKGKGGRKMGTSKNQHTIVLPEGWFERLSSLGEGETWYRKDYPQLARYSEKFGLVEFVQRFGAKATEKLREILSKDDGKEVLMELFKNQAEAQGYNLLVRETDRRND